MRAGAPFSQSLSATGGIAPYSFALDSGSLPPGLTFAGNTISGTPTRRGSYSFAVKVTDNVGATQVKSRSEEHTSELQSLMRISYAVFCLKKKKHQPQQNKVTQ